MKRSPAVEQARSVCMQAGKFNDRLDALASGTAEVTFVKAAGRTTTKLSREFCRRLRDMTLQHGRAATIQFVAEGCGDRRMIVAQVMHAVSGEKIQDSPAVFGKELDAGTARVADIHLEQIEKSYPLRVNVRGVIGFPGVLLARQQRSRDGMKLRQTQSRPPVEGLFLNIILRH